MDIPAFTTIPDVSVISLINYFYKNKIRLSKISNKNIKEYSMLFS